MRHMWGRCFPHDGRSRDPGRMHQVRSPIRCQKEEPERDCCPRAYEDSGPRPTRSLFR